MKDISIVKSYSFKELIEMVEKQLINNCNILGFKDMIYIASMNHIKLQNKVICCN